MTHCGVIDLVAICPPYGSVSKRPRPPNLRGFVLVKPFDIDPPAHHPTELGHNDAKRDALGEEQREAIACLNNPIKTRGDQCAIDARAIPARGVVCPVVSVASCAVQDVEVLRFECVH